MRLRRFKDVCLEKRISKRRIEKLMETRETLAVRELERAESELERITAKAAAIRSQMEASRLADTGDIEKNEETMSCNSDGPLNPTTLPRTVDVDGGSLAPLDTPVVKDSTRNSTSYKSAESPVSSPSNDERHSVVGSQDRTSLMLNRRSEGGTSTLPVAGEGEQSCDELLALEAQNYADLCNERRVLEGEIEKELADQEQMALVRVESARSSLEDVREKLAGIRAGLKRASVEDAVIVVPPLPPLPLLPPTAGDPDEGDRVEDVEDVEDALPTAPVTRPFSSEAKVDFSSSVSDTSIHNKPPNSLHVPESPNGSHFAQPTLLSAEENHPAGSQTVSVYKTRKKLTKRGLKPTERPRTEEANPLTHKSILLSLVGD